MRYPFRPVPAAAAAVFSEAALTALLLLNIAAPTLVGAQTTVVQALKTPLGQETLSLLANEISGQMAFDNELRLVGAPWVRERAELTGRKHFYESDTMLALARSYGIETVRLVESSSDRTFSYPMAGALWTLGPPVRLIGRIGADAALVASGSRSAEGEGRLVYLPPLDEADLAARLAADPERYRGAFALMWSHARGRAAELLDGAGIQAVISFASRERYFDPDQVVYSSGSYGTGEHLKMGFTVSWRQWSELLEDVEAGREVVLRGEVRMESFPDRFETVYAWLPGTEPEAPGVVFTAHLFEGYTKRGANDNAASCALQLEILRALHTLIARGELPRPRRTIHFIWPNEISGTYEFIKQHPGIAEQWSININMDMVSEALRKNNSWFTMSECPDQLPSYLDGLTDAVMNYVWRTNDIVYLPDAPRGRPGGQYFPAPLWEKNGSRDAFRYFVHEATGGSDHLCFNNPSVAVPGIELFTWPDQWYHADADTPDKSDPTQMKRVAFIGAACAWAAADCTDEVAAGLVDAASDFGYARLGKRELPRALGYLEEADAAGLAAAWIRADLLLELAVARESGALASIREVYTGSPAAEAAVAERIAQWSAYHDGLRSQVAAFARARADRLGVRNLRRPAADRRRRELEGVVPDLSPAVRGQEFSLGSFPPMQAFSQTGRERIQALGLDRSEEREIPNWIDGRRSIAEIRDRVAARTGRATSLEGVAGYLAILKDVGWVVW
jgi:aminopeptidase YwaD